MPQKELSRHQLSSKLSYQAQVPAFLQKFQNRVAGIPDPPSDEDEPRYEDDEFEYVGGGRAPIPKRPPIPRRPSSQPGSGDEEGRGGKDDDDDDDERPQIVVLKEGKHLSEREVENIKRKEKGLPPLPESHVDAGNQENDTNASAESKDKAKPPSHPKGLSFSSGKTTTKTSHKRKAISQLDVESENDLATQMGIKKLGSSSKDGAKPGGKGERKEKPKKKPKKESKKLLSFGDDA